MIASGLMPGVEIKRGAVVDYLLQEYYSLEDRKNIYSVAAQSAQGKEKALKELINLLPRSEAEIIGVIKFKEKYNG